MDEYINQNNIQKNNQYQDQNNNDNMMNNNQNSQNKKYHKSKYTMIIVEFIALIGLILILLITQSVENNQNEVESVVDFDEFDFNPFIDPPESAKWKQVDLNTLYKCPTDIKAGTYIIKATKNLSLEDCQWLYIHYKKNEKSNKSVLNVLLDDEYEDYIQIKINKGNLLTFELGEDSEIDVYITKK